MAKSQKATTLAGHGGLILKLAKWPSPAWIQQGVSICTTVLRDFIQTSRQEDFPEVLFTLRARTQEIEVGNLDALGELLGQLRMNQ